MKGEASDRGLQRGGGSEVAPGEGVPEAGGWVRAQGRSRGDEIGGAQGGKKGTADGDGCSEVPGERENTRSASSGGRGAGVWTLTRAEAAGGRGA